MTEGTPQSSGKCFSALYDRAGEWFDRWNPSGIRKKSSFLQNPETWLFIAYCTLTLVMVVFHEPWRDEAQGYIVTRDLSLIEVIRHLRKELHFPLWYVLLYPFAHSGFSILAANLLHWLLACGTAFLIMTKSPFRLWTKTILIFSFPLFFEFSVIARNYTVGLLLGAAVLSFWKRRWEKPCITAVFPALMFLCDPFFWGTGLGLCCCFLCEAVQKRLVFTKKILFSGLIALSGILTASFTFFQFSFSPGGETSFGNAVLITNALTGLLKWDTICSRLAMPFVQISAFFGIPVFLSVLLLIVIILRLKDSGSGLILLSVNTFCTYLLFLAGGFDSLRHYSFFFFGVIAALWITFEQETTHPHSVDCKTVKKRAGILLFIFTAVCAVQPLRMSLEALRNEVLYDFSHGKYAATFLRTTFPAVPVFCDDITFYTPVLAELPGKKFFSFRENKWTSFSNYDQNNPSDKTKIAENVVSRLPAETDFGLYIAMVHDLPAGKWEGAMFPVYSSLDSEGKLWGRHDESYWIFLVPRPEKKKWLQTFLKDRKIR